MSKIEDEQITSVTTGWLLRTNAHIRVLAIVSVMQGLALIVIGIAVILC